MSLFRVSSPPSASTECQHTRVRTLNRIYTPSKPAAFFFFPLHCTQQHSPTITTMAYLQKPHRKLKAKPKPKPRTRQARRSITHRKYRVTIRSLPKEIRQSIFLMSYLDIVDPSSSHCLPLGFGGPGYTYDCDNHDPYINEWTTNLLKVDAALRADIGWAAKAWSKLHQKEAQDQYAERERLRKEVMAADMAFRKASSRGGLSFTLTSLPVTI